MTEMGNKVQFRKSRTFIAGLALKQNRPELALDILKGETTYVTMRHIKLLAWAQIGQFDQIFEMFRQLIERHSENPKLKPFSSISVVSILKCCFVYDPPFCFFLCTLAMCILLQLNDIETCIKLKGSSQDIQNFRKIRQQIESLELTTNQVNV